MAGLGGRRLYAEALVGVRQIPARDNAWGIYGILDGKEQRVRGERGRGKIVPVSRNNGIQVVHDSTNVLKGDMGENMDFRALSP